MSLPTSRQPIPPDNPRQNQNMLLLSRFRLTLCCAIAVLTPSVDLIAEPVVLRTSDGAEVTGEITKWGTAEITLTSAGESKSYSTKELLQVSRQEARDADLESSTTIELVDGSRFAITEFTLTDRVATVHTPLDKNPLTVPAEQVRFVQLLPAANQSQAWQREAVTGDILVVTKKDSVETEMLSGVINVVGQEKVLFTWEGDTIPVKRAKIAGLGFYQAGTQEVAEPTCWLVLTSGARLAASKIDQQGSKLQVTTVTGLDVTVPFDEVASADYSVGKLSYISDMEPLISKWTPLVELPVAAESIRNHGAPRRNISFGGSPLTLLWPADAASGSERFQNYNKGLALRSRSELEYRLPKSMRRFVATAGIDPEMVGQGNVLLTIETDGEVAFSETISGDQPPKEIDIDIINKQRLRIIVDYGENLDLGDLLHLVEARLVK
jgi:hypothetical protein